MKKRILVIRFCFCEKDFYEKGFSPLHFLSLCDTIVKNTRETAMQFIEITTYTTTQAADLIGDLMWNHTNYGVAISDPQDIQDLKGQQNPKWDYLDESLFAETQEAIVKCYVAKDVFEKEYTAFLQELTELKTRADGVISLGSLETVTKEVDGDAWREVWKSHYKPIPIGNIVVCPEWIPYQPKDGEQVVKIDSNMAFGTGEHETTSMCVELLQQYVKAGDTVLDVGTGSGILGIAMVKLGAEKAYMTDIDYVAVQSAKKNAENNGVSKNCEIAENNLLDDLSVKGRVVTANITAGVLITLSKTILPHVEEGGVLILSGIINARKQEVLAAYRSLGFTLLQHKNKGEWNALALRREQ